MPEDIRLAENSPLIFSHNSEIDVTLTLSVIAKKKSDQIAKSEKRFSFLTTLIAFVIAYIISVMRTGFLMADTCVHE